MKTKLPSELFSSPYLASRAIAAVEDSLEVLQGPEVIDFAADALASFEDLTPPAEEDSQAVYFHFLDTLYNRITL